MRKKLLPIGMAILCLLILSICCLFAHQQDAADPSLFESVAIDEETNCIRVWTYDIAAAMEILAAFTEDAVTLEQMETSR